MCVCLYIRTIFKLNTFGLKFVCWFTVCAYDRNVSASRVVQFIAQVWPSGSCKYICVGLLPQWCNAVSISLLAMGLCLSVCRSDGGIMWKWVNLGLCKQFCRIAQGLQFTDTKHLCETRIGSLPVGAPNTAGIGKDVFYDWSIILLSQMPYCQKFVFILHNGPHQR